MIILFSFAPRFARSFGEFGRTREEQKPHRLRWGGLILKSNLDAGTLVLVHDIIEAIEETCDRAEDSADLVRIFAIS